MVWRGAMRALLALLLLSAPLLAAAGLPETPRFRQIGVGEGLPSNRVNAIAQDKRGYIWIGTSDGLARFDGRGYRVWRREEGLRDNYVWAVHIDAQDRVWVGTGEGGLAVLDRDRRSWRQYDSTSIPGLGAAAVWTVVSDSEGAIWFGTSIAGLFRMDAHGVVTNYRHQDNDPTSLPDNRVTSLGLDAKGTLWIGTHGGVASWTPDRRGGGTLTRLSERISGGRSVDSITVEPDGTLWFGSGSSVLQRKPDGEFDLAPMAKYGKTQVLRVMAHDRSGGYWIDVPDGLGRIDEERIVNVPLYSASALGIVKPTWSNGIEDRSGGLWLASDMHGAWYLPPNWRMFSVLSRSAFDPNSMGNANVKGIAPSADGNMWLVGSGGMLDRLDPETGAVEHLVRAVGGSSVPGAVLEDTRGAVWVGYTDGLTRYLPSTGQIKRWQRDDAVDPGPKGVALTLQEDAEGNIWAAMTNGTMQVRDANGRVLLNLESGSPEVGGTTSARQLVRGPDGSLWLSGDCGLLAWNSGAKRFDPVPGAPESEIVGIALGNDSMVWVAENSLLERYRWDGVRLTLQQTLGVDDGLPLLDPAGITLDTSGIIWLTSVRGLLRVDPVKRQVRIYGVQDGLPSQDFSGVPVQRPADGRILAGSPDGLVIFDPNVVRPSTDVPQLVVEAVSVRRGDRVVEFPADQFFVVDSGDRDVRVVARLLSFTSGGANRYQFKLEGFDDDWMDAGADGQRVFSALRAGSYQLLVKARNADNVWSKVAVISFDVAAPWWRRPWALALWAGVAALLAIWIQHGYRVRLRRRSSYQLSLHKRELAEQASLAKTRFLATLGHEVRTPMTGVLGMSELLMTTSLDERQRSYTDSIRRAGEHLMRLVNDALDLARIEAGRLELDVQPFDVCALVSEVCGLMGPLAERRGLRFRRPPASCGQCWVSGDAGRVRQILMNLLGNAIKFTEQGEVGLLFAQTADGIRFVVSDTGPGLNDEQRQRLFRRFEQADGARTTSRYGGSGLGLAICQELCAAMSGRIGIDSAPGEGTRFTVELPLLPCLQPVDALEVRPAAHTAAAESLRVLLVEDDPTVAEVITGLLQQQGHVVTHAAHGLAALAETSTAGFDIALLDLDLPGIDGLALARHLRAQGVRAPLLAVTARADADAEPTAKAAGFDGFLRKPLTGAMLSGAIEALRPPGVGR